MTKTVTCELTRRDLSMLCQGYADAWAKAALAARARGRSVIERQELAERVTTIGAELDIWTRKIDELFPNFADPSRRLAMHQEARARRVGTLMQ